MCYGYFTTIPILYIQDKLLFQNEKECLKFLKEKNAIIDEELNNLLSYSLFNKFLILFLHNKFLNSSSIIALCSLKNCKQSFSF